MSIRLTTTVKKGGCAAKIAAFELRKILADITYPENHAAVLVDGRHFDDAAVYSVTPDLALVQTIDFFTPIVDSAKLFGQIAAANAISDVYAMGGKPKTCLAVLAFPLGTLANEVISEVLQGACDKIKEAGANLLGGHSIDDDTLKFGLSVTGYVDPKKIWANTGAKAGDVLILTKALGTGTLTAALKREAVSEKDIEVALHSMAQLNNAIDFLSKEMAGEIHAATDVTGFGLSGHAMQMANASQVRLEIQASLLPVLPGAQMTLEKEFLTKAHRTNREYTSEALQIGELPQWQELLLHDPQSSGGLLLSVSESAAAAIIAALKPHFPFVGQIGRVLPALNQEKPLAVF